MKTYNDVIDHIRVFGKLLDNEEEAEKIISEMETEKDEIVNKLPEENKTVVILCDLEGLSYEEIAEFLNVPIGTVRSRLHRGRKILQKKLQDYAKSRGYTVETQV